MPRVRPTAIHVELSKESYALLKKYKEEANKPLNKIIDELIKYHLGGK